MSDVQTAVTRLSRRHAGARSAAGPTPTSCRPSTSRRLSGRNEDADRARRQGSARRLPRHRLPHHRQPSGAAGQDQGDLPPVAALLRPAAGRQDEGLYGQLQPVPRLPADGRAGQAEGLSRQGDRGLPAASRPRAHEGAQAAQERGLPGLARIARRRSRRRGGQAAARRQPVAGQPAGLPRGRARLSHDDDGLRRAAGLGVRARAGAARRTTSRSSTKSR